LASGGKLSRNPLACKHAWDSVSCSIDEDDRSLIKDMIGMIMQNTTEIPIRIHTIQRNNCKPDSAGLSEGFSDWGVSGGCTVGAGMSPEDATSAPHEGQ
jgi:hypothetical protein